MKFWIVFVALVLAVGFCGYVVAQEKSAESPATKAEASTTEEGAAESPGTTADAATGEQKSEKPKESL